MRDLLISLSGARLEILQRCPTERLKFQSLGWAILSSSVLAAVSIWFGLSSAIGVNPFLALPFALAWGVIVMGIERWLVTSLPSHGRRRWAIIVPRLLLAVLLGVLVAAPLVLRVFQPEINAQIAVINQNAHNEASNGLLIRLQALDQLSSGHIAVNVSRLLLFVLFLVIECLPLVIRLIQQPGNYEAILQNIIELELKNAKRALRNPPSVGRYRPAGDDLYREPLLHDIWQRPNEPIWTNGTITQPQQPLLYQPEESDEHTRREDDALRGMEDISTVADLEMRGGIALRYDEDDI
jgi:hypothetical protein